MCRKLCDYTSANATLTVNPNPSVEFLRSGPTLSYDIFVFRFYEAAVRDLRQSAISCPWRLHLDFSCQVESNGWFSAIKLIARISGPGHNPPVGVTFQFLLVVRPVIELSGRYTASKLMTSRPQPGQERKFDTSGKRSLERLLRLKPDATLRDSCRAQVAALEYIEVFCKRKRQHSTLGYRSPVLFLENWIRAQHQDELVA